MKGSKFYNKVGRPSVITEEVVVKLIAAFQNGLSDTTACKYAKISRDSYYERRKKDNEFADKMDDAKNFLKLLAGNRLVQILKSGSDSDAIPLIKFILEKLETDQFGKKDGLTINQKIHYIDPNWWIPPVNTR